MLRRKYVTYGEKYYTVQIELFDEDRLHVSRTVECVPANEPKEKDVKAYLPNDRSDSSHMEL